MAELAWLGSDNTGRASEMQLGRLESQLRQMDHTPDTFQIAARHSRRQLLANAAMAASRVAA